MKNKDEKKKDLEELKKALAENKNIFVTGYEKMTVGQDFELRKTIREAGGSLPGREKQSGGQGDPKALPRAICWAI